MTRPEEHEDLEVRLQRMRKQHLEEREEKAKTEVNGWPKPIPLGQSHGPEFNQNMFPDVFRDWVRDCSESIQVARDLPAMLELGIVGSIGAGRFAVELPTGHLEPINPWTLTALPSGERKSSVFRESIAPVREWELERSESTRHEVAEYHATVRTLEKALNRAEEKAGKTGGDWTSKEAQDVKLLARQLSDLKGKPVVAPRVVVDDVSPEKLAEILAEHRRILIASPEGGTFDMMAGRYNGDAAPNLDIYLKSFTGDDHLVDRIGRQAKHVRKALLAMALTTQPEVVRNLAKKPGFLGRGITARFWYSRPRGRAGYQESAAPAIPEKVRTDRRRALRALLDIPMPESPHILKFSPEAAEHWEALHNAIQKAMRDEGDLAHGHIKDWGARAAGSMGRLAGILHVMQNAEKPLPWEPISGNTGLRARHLVQDYLVPHALAAFALMGSDGKLELAQEVLAWIKRHRPGRFSRADMHRDLRRQVDNPNDWDPALSILTDHSYIAIEPQPEAQNGRPGRPPTPTYLVNPAVYGEGGAA